jgi:hypothetical protein
MMWRATALVLAVGLAGCAETNTGDSSSLVTGSAAAAGTQQKAAQLPRCEKSLGTVALVEKEIPGLAQMELTSPVPLLRLMIAQSGCLQVIDQSQAAMARIEEERAASGKKAAPRKVAMPDYLLTPDIISQNADAGGYSGGLGKALPGLAGIFAGGVSAKTQEAQTALYLTNAKTSVQLAAVTGSAQTTDFGFSMASLGPTAASVGGAYSNTPMGKTVTASFLDAYTKLVTQLQALPPPQAPKAHKKKTAAAKQ